ncbi:hypothetical protein J1F30_003240 [Bifidobacterium asteroides]|nr:hypothetical protein [Bifidobacterium asteroides]
MLKYSGNELFASLSPLVNTMLSSRVELGMYPAKPRPEALEAHDQVAEGYGREKLTLPERP